MKDYRRLVLSVSAVATMALVPGCASFSTDNNLATVFGPVEFINGALYVTDKMPQETIWPAANGALRELQITVTTTEHGAAGGRLEGIDAQNRNVRIQMTVENKFSTKIQIVVGTLDCTDNRSEEQQIYDKMKDRYAPVRDDATLLGGDQAGR